MERILCSCLKQEGTKMEHPPFFGALGKEIQEKVSVEGFAQWQDLQMKIINEYRLDLSEPEHRTVLMGQMRQFLGLEAQKDLLEVENPKRGGGCGSGGCC